jgi:hypothetical protein
MSKQDDELFQRLREAMGHEPPDTPLGKEVARLREPFDLGDGINFHYERFVEMFAAIRKTLHELDPSISPVLPAEVLDPAFIARVFQLPLEKFNYQGGSQKRVDPETVKQLKITVELLESEVSPEDDLVLNETEKNILEALGDKTLKGEELAPLAGYSYDGHFKGVLAGLVKRRILGNKHPGYYRR